MAEVARVPEERINIDGFIQQVQANRSVAVSDGRLNEKLEDRTHTCDEK